MQPTRLFLKGFKGLKAGMGLDEVTLDLTKLAGLIAITGPNGMGKTTLLDSIQPFRLMPYKLRESKEWSPNSFSYYDHCYGEATKELIFTHGGITYKSLILIDADRKKQEAYLFQDLHNGNAEPMWKPLCDGKTRTYDAAIESVVGSPSLFFTSNFRAQDARKLSSYPRSEILNIVCELLNIDHIKEQGKKASDVHTGLVSDMVSMQNERDKLQRIVDDVTTRIKQELSDNDIVLADIDKQIADYHTAITGLQQQLKDAEILQASQAEAQKRLDMLTQRKKELEAEIAEISASEISNMKTAKEALSKIDIQIIDNGNTLNAATVKLASMRQEIAEIESKTAGLEEKITVAKDRIRELQEKSDEYTKITDAKREEARTLQTQVGKLKEIEATMSGVGRRLSDLEARSEMLNRLDCKADASSWINDACPLLVDAVKARNEIPALKEEWEALEKQTIQYAGAELSLEDIVVEGKRLKSEHAKVSIELDDAIAESHMLHNLLVKAERLTVLKEQVPGLESQIATAEARKDELAEQKTACAAMVEEITKDSAIKRSKVRSIITELEPQITEAAVAASGSTLDIEEIKSKEESLRKGIAARDVNRQSVIETIGELKAEISKGDKHKVRIEELTEQIVKVGTEASAWSIIAQACSNDGIIALEIDASGPTIASIANELLIACYGSRFTVKLETQAVKADGGLKEVFDIIVYSSELDEAKSIRDMSGGERVTIEDAVTRAISIFNSHKNGGICDTLFSDEADGALDSEKKREFMVIKREAMKIGGHGLEYFISQTPDLMDMADHRIVLSRGSVTVQ